MSDLSHITDDELKNDLDANYGDMLNLHAARKLGLTELNGASIEDMFYKAYELQKVIEDEIERRLTKRAPDLGQAVANPSNDLDVAPSG